LTVKIGRIARVLDADLTLPNRARPSRWRRRRVDPVELVGEPEKHLGCLGELTE
jgi:hypothetical protein